MTLAFKKTKSGRKHALFVLRLPLQIVTIKKITYNRALYGTLKPDFPTLILPLPTELELGEHSVKRRRELLKCH